MVTGLGGLGEPGFALDSEDNLFVGVLGEGAFPVVAKLEGITGKPLISQLDGEESTGVAVNTADVLSNEVDERNDVYVDNKTAIAEFAPEAEGEPGPLIQRFGAPGLAASEGVAVDHQTGAVYVTDAASDNVEVFELEPPGPPRIEDLSVESAPTPAPDARRVSAQVEPTGSDTHYYFEYGQTSCVATPSRCTKTPALPTDLGGGFAGREVSLELTGLAPATYHYRVIAESLFGTVESPERTFLILGLSSGLPDGRAWEMVTPPDKHGAAIEALTSEGGAILASEDGDALAYVANGAIEEEVQGNRSFEPQQALATRGPGGWSSQDIATPNDRGVGANFGAPEYQFFSSDLSLALVEPYVSEPPLAPGVTGKTVYLRDDQPIVPEAAEQQSYSEAEANAGYLAPGFLPLVSEADAPEATFPVGVSFLDATTDLNHVVIDSARALTGSSSGAGLYERSEGSTLRFLSALPGWAAGAVGGAGLLPHAGARDLKRRDARDLDRQSGVPVATCTCATPRPERTIQLDKAAAGHHRTGWRGAVPERLGRWFAGVLHRLSGAGGGRERGTGPRNRRPVRVRNDRNGR